MNTPTTPPAGLLAGVTETVRPIRSWPILLLALPAFVAIWSGWVGLGELTGFGPVKLLPGIWEAARINSAITLPIGMETYAAYALHVMLSARVSTRARTFARWSAIGSLVLGAAGQVAYHLMSAARITHAPGLITALVACLPVAVLGMGAALAHLVHEDTPDASAPAEPDTSTPGTRRQGPADASAQAPGDGSGRPARAGTATATRTQATRTARPTKPAGTDTAAKVARLRAKRPDLTQTEIAKELKVTERTVRRYWTTPAATKGSAPAPTVLPTTDPDGPAPTTTTQSTAEASDGASRAA